ncbi:response regulator transcription factor [Streptomyces olivoreticuli]
MTSVILAEDESLLRQLLGQTLESAGICVVAEAADGVEALAAIESHQADVLLLDLHMPRLDGMGVLEALDRGTGQLRVLAITAYATDEALLEALRAGADGFMLKSCAAADLVAAIRTVARGEIVVPPEFLLRLIERAARSSRPIPQRDDLDKLQSLPLHDRRILLLLSRGLSNNEIAGELGITPTTAKTYVSRLLQRMEMNNRTQLALWAARLESMGATLTSSQGFS